MSEQTKAELEVVEAALNAISEHWENVIILCNRAMDAHETKCMVRSRGNYYARLGQVREWLSKEEEKDRIEVRQGRNCQ